MCPLRAKSVFNLFCTHTQILNDTLDETFLLSLIVKIIFTQVYLQFSFIFRLPFYISYVSNMSSIPFYRI